MYLLLLYLVAQTRVKTAQHLFLDMLSINKVSRRTNGTLKCDKDMISPFQKRLKIWGPLKK